MAMFDTSRPAFYPWTPWQRRVEIGGPAAALHCCLAVAVCASGDGLLLAIAHTVSDVTGHSGWARFHQRLVVTAPPFSGRTSTLLDLQGYRRCHQRTFLVGSCRSITGVYPLFVLPVFWPLAQLPYLLALLAVWTAGLFAAFAAVTAR